MTLEIETFSHGRFIFSKSAVLFNREKIISSTNYAETTEYLYKKQWTSAFTSYQTQKLTPHGSQT